MTKNLSKFSKSVYGSYRLGNIAISANLAPRVFTTKFYDHITIENYSHYAIQGYSG